MLRIKLYIVLIVLTSLQVVSKCDPIHKYVHKHASRNLIANFREQSHYAHNKGLGSSKNTKPIGGYDADEFWEDWSSLRSQTPDTSKDLHERKHLYSHKSAPTRSFGSTRLNPTRSAKLRKGKQSLHGSTRLYTPKRSRIKSAKSKKVKSAKMVTTNLTPRHIIKHNSTNVEDELFSTTVLVTLKGIPHKFSIDREVGTYFSSKGWSKTMRDMSDKHGIWSTLLPDHMTTFFKSTMPVDPQTHQIIYSKSLAVLSKELRGKVTRRKVSHVSKDVYMIRQLYPETTEVMINMLESKSAVRQGDNKTDDGETDDNETDDGSDSDNSDDEEPKKDKGNAGAPPRAAERNAFKTYVPYGTGLVAGLFFFCLFRNAYKTYHRPRPLVPDIPNSAWQKMGTLQEIYVYPVKSCGSLRLNEAECSLLGLKAGHFRDRFLMIINEARKAVSAREHGELLGVRPAVRATTLSLQHRDMELLQVNLQDVKSHNKTLTAFVCNVPVTVLDCGWGADEWISRLLVQNRENYKLVYYADETNRPLKGKLQKVHRISKHDTGALADECSFHLINQASVDDLNTRLSGQKVTPRHFRPNLVVAGAKAYEEDQWKMVKIGQSTFTVIKPCYRCIMTTLDPDTGKKNETNEPLATLRSYRVSDNKETTDKQNGPPFGLQLALRSAPGATISVNDPVYVVNSLCFCPEESVDYNAHAPARAAGARGAGGAAGIPGSEAWSRSGVRPGHVRGQDTSTQWMRSVIGDATPDTRHRDTPGPCKCAWCGKGPGTTSH